jgi:lipoprotein-releasing system permease protein
VISGFSLVGIALGVATLIIVMSVMGGFRKEFLASILGFNGHVIVQSAAGPLPNFDAMTARLKAVPGVTRAAPIADGQVMAAQNGLNTGVYVRGERPGDLASLKMVVDGMSKGALPLFGQEDTVIIGDGLARKLGIRRGGSITLIAPRGDVTPFGTTPRIKTYQVAGTFKVGNNLYDSGFVFMPLDEAQNFFNLGEGVTGVEVMVQKPDDDMAMMPAIAKAAGPGTRLVPWQEIDSSFMQAVQVEANVMFLILSLIILVAALNIISGLIMLVKDKSADIAILRTMGASRSAVMRIFLIAGMSIGVLGTFLGFLLGVLFCVNIESIRQGLTKLTGTPLFDPTVYFLSKIPADLDPWQVTSVVTMALVLTFLATLYPSWRAARLDPVEALRYE